MQIRIGQRPNTVKLGDMNYGQAFMLDTEHKQYRDYLYMRIDLSCKGLDHKYPNDKRPVVNLKSGTVRLLDYDQGVYPTHAVVEAEPSEGGCCHAT